MTKKATIETLSEQQCYGGVQGYYQHQSQATGTEMKFSVYQPPSMNKQPVPALYFLAGLTCTEEKFMIKAGAQRIAAELGLALVACDTSPRGLNYTGEDDDWDFGTGAGFYVDATQSPWRDGYQMSSYINDELPDIIQNSFNVLSDKRGIFGHSMGGHGAIVAALQHPDFWHSVSAYAPICNPSKVPWGQKAFTHYLGDNTAAWQRWDATELLLAQHSHPQTILIDQGLDDQFLDRELSTETFKSTAEKSGQKTNIRFHQGYDHSYYFIQTFIQDHMQHHAKTLL